MALLGVGWLILTLPFVSTCAVLKFELEGKFSDEKNTRHSNGRKGR